MLSNVIIVISVLIECLRPYCFSDRQLANKWKLFTFACGKNLGIAYKYAMKEKDIKVYLVQIFGGL